MVRYLLLIGLAGLATSLCMADESDHTPTDSRKYYVEDIKSTMMQHIEDVVDEHGVFRLRDDKTGEVLTLKFVRIHDPVRQIGSDIYFA